MSYQRTGNPVGMKYTGKSAKKIKELRTKNPLMNLVEIGEELGCLNNMFIRSSRN